MAGTIITNIGAAKVANAVALGTQVQLTEMAVGDGNGNPVTPAPSVLDLVRERYRAPINSLYIDPNNTQQLIAELIIPANVGGWVVREVGVYDSAGDLIAYGSITDRYKPVIAEGESVELGIRVVMRVVHTSSVILNIDPAIVAASRKWVTDNFLSRTGGTTGQLLRKRSNANNDVEWFSPDEDSLNINISAVEEPQTLAAGQTIVDLAVVTTNGIAVYVEGSRLRQGIDYTITNSTRITLGQSWPQGTPLLAVQNDPNAAAGDVVGPEGATAGAVPKLDASGKVLSDSGLRVDADGNLYGHGAKILVFAGTALTLTAAHKGYVIWCTSATEVTITLPEDATEALPGGFMCALIQAGDGQIIVAKQGTDVITSADDYVRSAKKGAPISVMKVTSGSWWLGGQLAAAA